MDWKKNKFLIIVTSIMLVEVGVYFWFSSSYNSRLQESLEKIESAAQDVETVERISPKSDKLKNDKWVKFYREKKKQLLEEWQKCVDFYMKRYRELQKAISRHVPEHVNETTYFLRYMEAWNKLIQDMQKSGITFEKSEETDKTLGFDRLQQRPSGRAESLKAQKGFLIQETLARAMIRHGAMRFYESSLEFLQTKPLPDKKGESVFVLPFHIVRVNFTFSIPFHRLHDFLREILDHPYFNFLVRGMDISKDRFFYKYKTITPSGSLRTVQTEEMTYFDRAYFYIRLPEKEYGKFVGSTQEKVFFPPPVKVNLQLDVLDFDPKLVPSKEELLGIKKKSRARKRRRRR